MLLYVDCIILIKYFPFAYRHYLHPEDIEQSGIKIFDEENIQNYTKTFGIIARSIWNREEVKKFWQL